MIIEMVLFDNPPGLTREAELEGARAVVPKWQANADLQRKMFMRSEDGRQGGAVYVWPNKAAALAAHGDEWRAAVKARTGSEPVCRYFDVLIDLDNVAGQVREPA